MVDPRHLLERDLPLASSLVRSGLARHPPYQSKLCEIPFYRVANVHNARRAKPVAAERETLKALPKRRTTDFAMVTRVIG